MIIGAYRFGPWRGLAAHSALLFIALAARPAGAASRQLEGLSCHLCPCCFLALRKDALDLGECVFLNFLRLGGIKPKGVGHANLLPGLIVQGRADFRCLVVRDLELLLDIICGIDACKRGNSALARSKAAVYSLSNRSVRASNSVDNACSLSGSAKSTS